MYRAYRNNRIVCSRESNVPMLFDKIEDALAFLEEFFEIDIPMNYKLGDFIIDDPHEFQVREVTKIS